MLTEGSLHLVLYVPAAWEVLWLQHVNKVLSPHPHEVLKRRVITAFTCFEDSLDHFLSVWVCLLLVAQLERLEATPTAEFDEVEDLAAVSFQRFNEVLGYDLFDVIRFLHHRAKL